MKDSQLLRFSRQIMLPEMDVAGQQRLLGASVLVVGMGGLGCPAAMYLAAAGVGRLLIADDDVVEISNLQRQIAHSEAAIGQPKVTSAEAMLRGLNPDLKIVPLQQRLTGKNLAEHVQAVDAVVDACDNFATRFAVNRACIAAGKPLVSGAAIRMEGQVAVFDSRDENSPCYQCLYQQGQEEGEDDGDLSCARNGVMAPLVGIIGAVQAMETLKLLAGIGDSLCGRLLLLDATTMQWRELKLPKDPACSACGAK